MTFDPVDHPHRRWNPLSREWVQRYRKPDGEPILAVEHAPADCGAMA